jgi:hypothetical protein
MWYRGFEVISAAGKPTAENNKAFQGEKYNALCWEESSQSKSKKKKKKKSSSGTNL